MVPVGTATLPAPSPTSRECERRVTNLIEACPKEGNGKEGVRRDRRGGKEEKRGGERVVEARRRQEPGREPLMPPHTNNEDTQGNGKCPTHCCNPAMPLPLLIILPKHAPTPTVGRQTYL